MVTVRTTAASIHADRARSTGLGERLRNEQIVRNLELPDRDDTLITAFRSLSPRWRQVIWWSEIEGQSPAEFGQRIGLSASAASALSYRARRALREAYLTEAARMEAAELET